MRKSHYVNGLRQIKNSNRKKSLGFIDIQEVFCLQSVIGRNLDVRCYCSPSFVASQCQNQGLQDHNTSLSKPTAESSAADKTSSVPSLTMNAQTITHDTTIQQKGKKSPYFR